MLLFQGAESLGMSVAEPEQEKEQEVAQSKQNRRSLASMSMSLLHTPRSSQCQLLRSSGSKTHITQPTRFSSRLVVRILKTRPGLVAGKLRLMLLFEKQLKI